MAIFSRLADLLKANINDLLDKAEDPQKMLKMIVIEMEEHLQNATQSIGQVLASERQMRRQIEEAQQNARMWEDRAKAALKAGDESKAKQAVESKIKADADTRQREKAHAEFYAETEEMRVQLNQLKVKIEETRSKEAILIARANMAKAKLCVAETLGGGSLSKVSVLESKIQLAEDTADAHYELSGLDTADKDPFAGAESSSAVEEELGRLKREMQ